MANIHIAQLLKAGVHFGHKSNRWNPKMFPYIFTERNGIHILDLVQTVQCLNEASKFLTLASEKGKTVLFVGTKPQASALIAQEAQRCNSFYINHRWLGGMLTNWKTVKKRIDRLKELEEQFENGRFDLLPKKESTKTMKELIKLRRYLGGLKDMTKKPDILIVIDQRRELTAVREAIKLGIPVLSILDTNCDPDLVDIPIPGNDDSIGSIKIILKTLSTSILSGQEKSANE